MLRTPPKQVSTGRRVNNPGDDPAAVAALVFNNAQTSQDAQFQTNISDLQSKFQVADSVMNSAVQLMTSAISLGTQGATGTLTDANRQSIAAQVAGLAATDAFASEYQLSRHVHLFRNRCDHAALYAKTLPRLLESPTTGIPR